uniref:Uncharacterized protein n=1 Tax=Caenorhabditis japonica TaxID=281687 RepID=A0A8R1IDU2_CAEJA
MRRNNDDVDGVRYLIDYANSFFTSGVNVIHDWSHYRSILQMIFSDPTHVQCCASQRHHVPAGINSFSVNAVDC